MTTLAVLGRGLLPRWKAVCVIVACILAFLLMGVAMVQSMDTNIYASLPPALLAMAGIPAGASAPVMSYTQMLGFLGAIAVAGFAVAVGAQLVAGEEKDGTLPLLLSHPISRVGVGATKAAVLVLAVGATSLGLWGAAALASLPFDLTLGDAHLGELCLALGANALVYGGIAFAVGGTTGSRGLALGAGAAVLGLGWLFAGLLPQWSEGRDLAQFIPWYWYSKPTVLLNGIDGGYLALMLGVAAVLLAVGVVGLVVRDLRRAATRTRPARHATTRWTGSAAGRGPSHYRLLVSRHAGLLLVLGVVMFAVMGLLMGPLYEQMAPQLETASKSLPPELMQVWGATDMAPPAGFCWGETMSLMAPAAVILAGAAVASRLGSDERSGRLGVLLSTPTTRTRMLATAMAAQATLVALVAGLTGLGIWGGVRLGGLDLATENVAGATAHLLALGLFIGSAALLAAAALGTPAAATWTATGVGLVGYVINTTMPMNPDLADWARISPFHWYGAANPLENGADWGNVAILLVGSAVLLAASFPLFTRRDLRV